MATDADYSEGGPNHICLVVKDRDKTIELLEAVLGMETISVFDAGFSEDNMIVGEPFSWKAAHCKFEASGMGPVGLEIMQPVGEKYTWLSEFIDTKGEGIHHVAFVVPDFDETVSKLEKRGFEKITSARTPSGKRFAYYELKPGGFFIEIMEKGMGSGFFNIGNIAPAGDEVK